MSLKEKSDRETCSVFLLLQICLGHYLPVEQVDDTVGKAGIVLRVRHHDDGSTLLVQLLQQVHHFLAVLRIEVTGRFVGQNQFRVGHYGTGNGHTLLLTAGELLREVLGTVADGHALHRLFDALLAFAGRHAHVEQRQFDVLIHVQLVNQVEALEYEADDTLAQAGALGFGIFRHFRAVQVIFSLRGVVQQAQNVEQGGLTAT